MKKVIKHSLAYLFLVFFISMKMAGSHALLHEDNHIEDCIVCEYTIVNNLIPTLVPDNQYFIFKKSTVFLQKKIAESYCFIVVNSIATNQLFSRPPPFLG